MSFLTQPTDLKEKKVFKGLIYGQPGLGKTTLALSSPNPVLIDLEEGIYRVESQYRVPSLQVQSFNEILDFINSDEINSFDTIVFDTFSKLLDFIVDKLLKETKRNQMRIQDFGQLKKEFTNLVKTLNTKNKSILFVAHEKEEKIEDKKYKRPDFGSGSSGNELIKELDFIGYMQIINKKRTISFTPDETFYAKNSLQLDDIIEVPNTKLNGNTFISEKIVKLTNEKIKKDTELRVKYNDLMTLIKNNINDLKTLEDVNNFLNDCKKYEIIWDSKIRCWYLLQEKAKELNLSYDTNKKEFIA